MARLARLIIAAATLSGLCGCAGGGLFRAIGSLPGVAWTDYAFTFYCDKATQLFQFTPPQVETSMLEALADMGFRVSDPPVHNDGECVISAKAPDGRTVRVTVSPQNAMTMVTVVIHPYLGDYQLSRDLLRRVALNFGSGMRAYTPVDLTLPRRFNPPNPIPTSNPPPPPEALKGDGLRPDLHQKESASDELDGTRFRRPAIHERARHHGRLHPDHGLPESTQHALRAVPLHAVQREPVMAMRRPGWRSGAETPIITMMVHRGPIDRRARPPKCERTATAARSIDFAPPWIWSAMGRPCWIDG